MDRQLTALRVRWTQHRTAVVDKIQTILRKWNMQHDCPTKGIQTKKARAWLAVVELPEMDRLEMDFLLEQWDLVNKQLEQMDTKIQQRRGSNGLAILLGSIPGMSNFNSLSVACRMGDIEDFPHSGSLANFWGLTPGSRNSGDNAASLGITKAGSSHVRYVLGQVVLHVIRKDAWMRQWYQKSSGDAVVRLHGSLSCDGGERDQDRRGEFRHSRSTYSRDLMLFPSASMTTEQHIQGTRRSFGGCEPRAGLDRVCTLWIS